MTVWFAQKYSITKETFDCVIVGMFERLTDFKLQKIAKTLIYHSHDFVVVVSFFACRYKSGNAEVASAGL
jgi:hypothetical protein